MEKMTIKNLVKNYLILCGHKGLCNHKKMCECKLSNLMYCDDPKIDCGIILKTNK